MTKKPAFLRGDLGSSSIIWTGTRYKLEILHQSVENVKTKSQKVLGPNSYVCRSYRGKTGRGGFLVASILNRVKMQSISVFLDIAKFADLTIKELKWTIM